ncbi:hypothetical protein F4808DRAFT_474949 [Astrocystis sublimbata]|nr:hypothetical protein F4808DRAFT_474949 [Astrocystis sublimbata]
MPSSPVECPFRKGDQFELPVPGIQYYPNHSRMRELNKACSDNVILRFKLILSEWIEMTEPSPPRGPPEYPLGTIEPTLYHAIRLDRPEFVAYLLDQGVKMSRLALWEAVSHHCTVAMWQVFIEHGSLDINAPIEAPGLPPLGYFLQDEKMTKWLLAHGADPNAQSRQGLTPFLKAVGHAPLSMVKLLHEAGADPSNGVPFVCSPTPNLRPREGRLDVLRYLLDAGADPDAKKWAHNEMGYASDFDYGSPLNAAIAGHEAELAEELLRRGASTNAQTLNIVTQGETALELARRHLPELVPLVEECRQRQREC